MEGEVHSGAQEQDEIHEHRVPEVANELVDNEGEEEEACTAKPLRDTRDPHDATHLLFRSCGVACAAGRRDKPPHRRVPPDENAVPETLMDNCFARRDDETETVTILVMKDRYPRAIQACMGRRAKRL